MREAFAVRAVPTLEALLENIRPLVGKLLFTI